MSVDVSLYTTLSATCALCGPPGQAGAASHHGLKNRPGPGESCRVPPRPGRAVGYLPGAPGGPREVTFN